MPKRTCILIVVSFTTKSAAPVKTAIEVAKRIRAECNVQRIFLCTDGIGPSAEAAEDARAAMGDPSIAPIWAFASDTGQRWGIAVQEARRLLKESSVECEQLLLLPGDFNVEAMGPDRIATLTRNLIGLVKYADANEFDFVVGDYDSNDHIKNCFDDIVTNRVLEVAFPDEFKAIQSVGLTKLRTEFWIINLGLTRFLDDFRWPRDPTPLMLTALSGTQDIYKIGKYRLGEFFDESPDRIGHLAKAAQAIRLAADSAVARALYEKDKRGSESDAQQRGCARDLRLRLEGIFRALEEALEALDDELGRPRV
jgi:hypothetical protein